MVTLHEKQEKWKKCRGSAIKSKRLLAPGLELKDVTPSILNEQKTKSFEDLQIKAVTGY